MKGLDKVITEADPTIKELAEAISAYVIEWYGVHNYEEFKMVISERLVSKD
jgi:hypothetical protein